jgi:putative NADPH-quinone reductase
MDILVLNGHPRATSLCGALADAYAEGARSAGVAVRRLDVAALTFDPDLTDGYVRDRPLEADLARVQEALRAARHVVVVTPTWWGTVPARLKGLLDRVLLPGFAFRYQAGSALPARLLAGRTGAVIVTMDSPVWYYRWITGDPITKTLVRATLDFVGIRVLRVTRLGPVLHAADGLRQRWLATVRRQGVTDARRLRRQHAPAESEAA